MTIAGDMNAMLSPHVDELTGIELIAHFFQFLTEADVLVRLQNEGFSDEEISAYCACVHRLANIVPLKRNAA